MDSGHKMLKRNDSGLFKELYNSVGPWNFDPVLQQCPSIVTAEMNQLLNVEITMEDVHSAVFQMGS